MVLDTDLGRHLYRYCSLKKTEYDPEIVQEFSEAYCVREGLSAPQILFEPSGNAIVEILVPDIRLDTYTKFISAFKAHGYPAPSLEVREIEDPSRDEESTSD